VVDYSQRQSRVRVSATASSWRASASEKTISARYSPAMSVL